MASRGLDHTSHLFHEKAEAERFRIKEMARPEQIFYRESMLPGLPPKENTIPAWFFALIIPVLFLATLLDAICFAQYFWGDVHSRPWRLVLTLISIPISCVAAAFAISVLLFLGRRFSKQIQKTERLVLQVFLLLLAFGILFLIFQCFG